MKLFQNALALAVVLLMGAAIYHFLSSHSLDRRVGTTERRLDDVSREAQGQGVTLGKHDREIAVQSEGLKAHGEDIDQVKKRLAAAEARIQELAQSAARDRGELEKLRGEIAELNRRSEAEARRRKELDDLSRDVKKSLQRDVELDRRLGAIEKQLGIIRPEP